MRLAESPELSELMSKGFSNPETFTPKETTQFQLFLRASFRNYENYYYQYRLGYFEEEIWAGYEQQIIDQVTRGLGVAWWEVHQVAFGKAFVEFVNSRKATHQRGASPWDVDLLSRISSKQ